jgi:hypothetical protein
MAAQLGGQRIHTTLLQLSGTVLSFLDAKDKLIDATETFRYIANTFSKPTQNQTQDEVMIIDVDEVRSLLCHLLIFFRMI